MLPDPAEGPALYTVLHFLARRDDATSYRSDRGGKQCCNPNREYRQYSTPGKSQSGAELSLRKRASDGDLQIVF